MMAKKLIIGANGSPSYVDTTPEDDAQAGIDAAAWEAAQVAPIDPPRDPIAELDALKAALVKKNVVSDSDIKAEAVAIEAPANLKRG